MAMRFPIARRKRFFNLFPLFYKKRGKKKKPNLMKKFIIIFSKEGEKNSMLTRVKVGLLFLPKKRKRFSYQKFYDWAMGWIIPPRKQISGAKGLERTLSKH